MPKIKKILELKVELVMEPGTRLITKLGVRPANTEKLSILLIYMDYMT